MESLIATRLKHLRKNLDMSAEKVVKLLKQENLPYSSQSIYKWEEGKALPTINTLKVLAKIYKCNISYLIDGEIYEYKRVTPIEHRLLITYRIDFLYRSIAIQIIKKIERNKKQ